MSRIPYLKTVLALLVLVVVLAAARGALVTHHAEPGIARAVLPNGLRVIVVRNTLAPTVSTAMNYFVGGDQASAELPGTAHALEHMMFRGSPGLSAAQLADLGSIMGGDFNANTQQSI